jgi:hypothetical protein
LKKLPRKLRFVSRKSVFFSAILFNMSWKQFCRHFASLLDKGCDTNLPSPFFFGKGLRKVVG